MEFGRVSEDHYAGYVVEDSDLEYSECSEADSSDDEGCHLSSACGTTINDIPWNEDLSSEEEFEKEVDSQALATLEQIVSPTAAIAEPLGGHMTSDVSSNNVESEAWSSRQRQSRRRRRRSSGAEQKKVVRFSDSVDDRGKGGPNEGQNSAQSEGVANDISSSAPGEEEYYDDIYFDSSDSDDEGGVAEGSIRKVGKKVRKMTNDELFYDPKMDEEDERWMKRQRMNYLNVEAALQLQKETLGRQIDPLGAASPSSSSSAPPTNTTATPSTSLSSNDPAQNLPKSDAVLNCPACMTTLCLDCQRHDIYVNQYRAMFVVNCSILREEVLKYFPKPDRRSRKRNKGKQKRQQAAEVASSKGTGEEEEEGTPELYHPVRCRQCNTEVAVYDKDEVFHFFNVLPSAPG